jgi:23S rRNA (adenine2503-C2)-methyltransferase
VTDRPKPGAARPSPRSQSKKTTAPVSRRQRARSPLPAKRTSPPAPRAVAPRTLTPQALTPQALLALYRPDISKALAAVGAPPYRHAQVCEHLLRRPLQPFSQATALPADTRDAMDALGVSTLAPAGARIAPDGTTKLLLSGRDGQCVETVLMRYQNRSTACISSQIGCPVGCAFCATGAMGFQRNLSAAEIVDQVRAAAVLAAEEGRRISNLVYMGMGEPLLNLQAVLESIRIVTDPSGLGMSHRAISVSTVGVPGGMLRLGRTEPQVNLALSLHAADDRTRALLIPESFCHPLSRILDAAWEHFDITHRKLLIEYVLLRGVNDSVDDARRLAGLLRGHVVTVNLITWNPAPGLGGAASRLGRDATAGDATSRGATSRGVSDATKLGTGRSGVFEPPVHAAVAAFRTALLGAGIEAVVRQSKGSGIQAACGQLAGQRGSYDKN